MRVEKAFELFRPFRNLDRATPIDERVAHALEYIATALGMQTKMMLDERDASKGPDLSMHGGKVKFGGK